MHYRFVDDDTFDRMISERAFLEWASFNGRRYGTPWDAIERPLQEGRTVVLEIDVQGAVQVRERMPDAVLVFLAPPDPAALEERLRARGTEDDAAVRRRLDIGRWELEQAARFDHRVVNGTVEQAVADLVAILDAAAAAGGTLRAPADDPQHLGS